MTRLTRKPFQHAINATEYYGWRARRNSSCTLCQQLFKVSSKWNGGVFDQKWLQGKSLYDEGLQRSKSVASRPPLLLLNPDWGDFALSLCICWSFTSPLSSSFFRIMEENMKCCMNVWQFHKNVSTRGVKFHKYEFIPVVVLKYVCT